MEQIVISQNENQQINISSNEPQIIKLKNLNNQLNININTLKNQKLSLNQNENQVILIGENGYYGEITDVLVNGVSVVSGNIAYVLVPTKTSELINDSGYITNENDPTVPYYIKEISISDINNWNNKQNQLVSGVNIKTINSNSILGSGNIDLLSTPYTAGTGISINSENVISNTITSYEDLTDLPTIPTKVSDLTNDLDFVETDELSEVAFNGSYNALSDTPDIPVDTSDLINDSGFIDKDVNDLTYYTLSSNLSTVATTGDYDDLLNKPTIPTVNNATLTIQQNGTNVSTFTANASSDVTANITVPTNVSDLNNDSGYITASDYATSSTGGTVKGNTNGFMVNSLGTPSANTYNYNEYTSHTNGVFIGKGTLENALSGKGYITSSALDNYTQFRVYNLGNVNGGVTSTDIATNKTFGGVMILLHSSNNPTVESFGRRYWNNNNTYSPLVKTSTIIGEDTGTWTLTLTSQNTSNDRVIIFYN